jgi:hypothetical protein
MYIKINTTVNLSSGLAIPAGSVVTIAEGYASIKDEKDGLIPAQVATFAYASEQAYADGLTPVDGIADFNPVFSGLELTQEAYATKTAESLLVDAVYDALVAIYGEANVEKVVS